MKSSGNYFLFFRLAREFAKKLIRNCRRAIDDCNVHSLFGGKREKRSLKLFQLFIHNIFFPKITIKMQIIPNKFFLGHSAQEVASFMVRTVTQAVWNVV